MPPRTLRDVHAVLIGLGAAVAVAVELLEALAIVLAVGASRRWRDALLGAAAAVALCVVAAVLLGPVLLQRVPVDGLRVVVGVLLLLIGLEWLRKGALRMAGRRSRSSALKEYVETREALEEVVLPPEGQPDWAGRVVAFKGVGLEGLEVVLIVSALASRPGSATPALIGCATALAVVAWAGVRLRGPLAQLPETELKLGVGVLLTAFGTFFAAEGLGVDWPGGDLAVLYAAGAVASVTLWQVAALSRAPA